MSKTEVNWGILSTAEIAQKVMIPAFRRSKNAEVTAIASGRGLTKSKEVARHLSIEKAYGSYEALLDDPKIDAVYIPLPNHIHKKWVIAAAKKGKHILCEKPAALNASEFQEIKMVCEQNNIIFMEAFMYHFHPQHARVREIIQTEEIGKVNYIRAGFTFPIGMDKDTNIRMSHKKGGGTIYDVGCYAIHSLRNIIGKEPKTVHVHATIDPKYEVDTDAVTYLTFPDGIRATFDVSFNLANRAEYEVFGTEGSIVVPRAYRPDWNAGEGLIIVEKDGIKRTETIHADQYCNQVEHISKVILNDVAHVDLNLENTLQNMYVIDACLQSIKSGQEVQLKTN